MLIWKNIFLYFFFLLIEFNIKWIFEYWAFCFEFLRNVIEKHSTLVFLNTYHKCRFKHFRINKFPSKLLFANFSRILCIIYNLVRKFSLREKREQDASPRNFLQRHKKRHKNLPPKRILSEEKKRRKFLICRKEFIAFSFSVVVFFLFFFFSFLVKEKKNSGIYTYIKDTFSFLFLLCYLFSCFSSLLSFLI